MLNKSELILTLENEMNLDSIIQMLSVVKRERNIDASRMNLLFMAKERLHQQLREVQLRGMNCSDREIKEICTLIEI